MSTREVGRGKHSALTRTLAVVAVVLVGAGVAAGLSIRSTIKAVPKLFQRSAAVKAQGYYTGEFEFKLLTSPYYLNEGSYLKAITTLRRLREELETTRGMVKMPAQGSPKEMMAFLLDRQDPGTGAFMNPNYPYFTYIAPTLNVVDSLQQLSRQTGQPLKLKHPLRFLDRVRSPDQLRAHLDSLLYLKERWAGLAAPGPYVAGVSEWGYYDILENSGVYRFSDEWKDALRKWYYETQDPESGLWGVRIGTPAKWRQYHDLGSTYHVLHLVLDDLGDNQSQKYPLRYAGRLVQSLLHELDKPVPTAPAKQHGWCLEQAQGTRMVTRLWTHLPDSDKEQARAAMRSYLAERYRHFFREVDGGFALYTASGHGDVDGTSTALSLLRATGSLPGTWERERLWGKAIAATPPPVRQEIRDWAEATLPPARDVASLRIYRNAFPASDGFEDADLLHIAYTGDSPVLDLMDLRQRTARFLATTEQSFGNWSSKEALLQQPLGLRREAKPISVSRGGLDLARIARQHPAVRRFCVAGYDVFQVPVVRVEFVGK